MKIFFGLLLVVATLYPAGLYASHDEQYQEVDGIAVYLTISPAEMLRGHPREHPESSMHSKERIEGRNQHHIMVSVFDAKTGVRLQGAVITATALAEGFTGTAQRLKLMTSGGKQTWGNFFSLPRQKAYRIALTIQPAGSASISKVVFQYASI